MGARIQLFCQGLATSLVTCISLSMPTVQADTNADAKTGSGASVSDSTETTAAKGLAGSVSQTQQQTSVSQIAARLCIWETKFFAEEFSAEPTDKRLSRLEHFVFGTTRSGDDLTRVRDLREALGQKAVSAALPAGVADNAPPIKDDDSPVPMPKTLSSPAVEPPNPAAGTAKVATSPPSTRDVSSFNLNQNPVREPNRKVSIANFLPDDKPERIIQDVNAAIRLNAKDAELLYERAEAYLQLGKMDRALSDLNDTIMTQPNKSEYYLARAFVYTEMGNSVLAKRDLEQARFVDPKFPAKIEFVGVK